jgi:hypothetical protein
MVGVRVFVPDSGLCEAQALSGYGTVVVFVWSPGGIFSVFDSTTAPMPVKRQLVVHVFEGVGTNHMSFMVVGIARVFILLPYVMSLFSHFPVEAYCGRERSTGSIERLV